MFVCMWILVLSTIEHSIVTFSALELIVSPNILIVSTIKTASSAEGCTNQECKDKYLEGSLVQCLFSKKVIVGSPLDLWYPYHGFMAGFIVLVKTSFCGAGLKSNQKVMVCFPPKHSGQYYNNNARLIVIIAHIVYLWLRLLIIYLLGTFTESLLPKVSSLSFFCLQWLIWLHWK